MTTNKRATTRKYAEGDWFAVPLLSGNFAAGVVARAARKGGILLGYFFGPAKTRIPSIQELAKHTPNTAALIAIFGDMGLIRGEWPMIGRTPDWDRAAWPLPVFARVDVVDPSVAFCVEYSPDDPATVIREYRCKPTDVANYPVDRLMGHGSVANTLNDLLYSSI